MKKFLALFAFAATFTASAVVPGLPYEPFEADYPTYVLSDDSAAKPQPFEADYPVQLQSSAPASYKLVCSNVNPAPFEDCYPVFNK